MKTQTLPMTTTTTDMSAKNRLFYSLPEREEPSLYDTKSKGSDLLSYIRQNIIGRDKVFSGPFGLRKALYLDYTASGRSLEFIEDYIRNEVLPEYGNTHTTSSVTSLQTTLYRHEARDIIRNAVHASEHDAVIFVGSGTTGAIHKLIHSLDLNHKPIVFVGPYEHHSNLLPWKEIGAKVMRIPMDPDGRVDIQYLDNLLQKWRDSGRQLIGCFSAASNITGTLCDTDAITVCLHRHDALAFWDYATAAPYMKVDMNPMSTDSEAQPYMYKDAIFISPHKFVGGVQTPGVLIAKKSLFRNHVPDGCGGGAVFFVRRDSHRYLQEPELKEEGGTPAIVEAVRAGLVFELKHAVGPPVIMDRQRHMYRQAIEAWRDCESLVLLGSTDVPRLPIFSFLVYHRGSGHFLHHNFVSVLLNDLFGIQARGGCACAGPYAMDLLGMEEDISQQFESLLAEDSRLDRTHLRRYREYSHREILRPGFTRINLPYHLDDEGLQYTLAAVRLVAESGWRLLPQYMFNPETGEWRQKHFQVFKDRKWLGHISYSSNKMSYSVPPPVVRGPLPDDYQDCLQKARDVIAETGKTNYEMADHRAMFDDAANQLRWFLLPSEAATCLRGNDTPRSAPLPFCPSGLRERLGMPALVVRQSADDCPSALEMPGDLCPHCSKPTRVFNGTDASIGDSESTHGHTEFSTKFPEHLDKGFKIPISCDIVCANSNLTFSDNQNMSAVMGTRKAGHREGYGDHGVGQTQVASDIVGNCCIDAGSSCDRDVGDGALAADTPAVSFNQPVGVREFSCLAGNTQEGVCRGDCRVHSREADGVVVNSVQHSGPGTCSSADGVATPVVANTVTSSDDMLSVSTRLAVTCRNISLSTSDPVVGATRDIPGDISVTRGSVTDSTQTPVSCSVRTCTDTSSGIPAVRGPMMSEVSVPKSAVSADNIAVTVEGGATMEQVDLSTALGDGHNNLPADTASNQTAGNTLGDGHNNLPADTASNQTAGNTEDKQGGQATRRKTNKWFAPPKNIFTPFLKAMEEHGMVRDGDRILVCLSGGKDSLSLLHTLAQYRFYARRKGVTFDLGVVTVDPQTPSYDPSPMKAYIHSLGLPYFYESQCIMEQASRLPYECASICSFCSRMKRGRIYACARREGYNVLALGQHLDDLCESFLMSLFHNGTLRTMKAHYTVEEGDLRVIRPFVYVREKDLRSFAEKNKLPVIAENCPACFEAPKERHRAKQLLAAQEIMFPQLFNSMAAAIHPIMAINRTGVKFGDFIQTDTSQDDDEI